LKKKKLLFTVVQSVLTVGMQVDSIAAMGIKQPGITTVPHEGDYSQQSSITFYINSFYPFFIFMQPRIIFAFPEAAK